MENSLTIHNIVANGKGKTMETVYATAICLLNVCLRESLPQVQEETYTIVKETLLLTAKPGEKTSI